MCLLTFFPPNVQPDTDRLKVGVDNNPHGSGYALIVGDQILVRRDLDGAALVKRFAKVRTKYPDGPALFHSRFATHGASEKENCHPFHVGDDPHTVMAHNGIFPEACRPKKGDPRSDTQIMAQHLGSEPFGSLARTRARKRLGKWIGPGNKIVILTTNPRYPQRSYLINEAEGLWDDGVWYSNYGYESYRMPTTTWAGMWITCQVCQAFLAVDPRTGYCDFCNSPDPDILETLAATRRHWWDDAASDTVGDAYTTETANETALLQRHYAVTRGTTPNR